MTPEDALERSEAILGRISGSVSGRGRHYRQVSLAGGKKLAIDVFRQPPTQGHIRVHVFHVTRSDIARLGGPVDGAATTELCPRLCEKCREIPTSYPAWYLGSKGEGHYFGFQWHGGTDITSQDLELIEQRVQWLTAHFPPK